MILDFQVTVVGNAGVDYQEVIVGIPNEMSHTDPFLVTNGFAIEIFSARLLREYLKHGEGTLISSWRSLPSSPGLTEVPRPLRDHKSGRFVESNRDLKLQSQALHGFELQRVGCK